METLIHLIAQRLLRPAPPGPAGPLDDPAIRAMDLRQLADLPMPRPPGPAVGGAEAGRSAAS